MLSDDQLHDLWEVQPEVQPAAVLTCFCGEDLFFRIRLAELTDAQNAILEVPRITCPSCQRVYQIRSDT